MKKDIVALIIVKKNSSRLKNKNWRAFGNELSGTKPMFQWNLEKCLKIFEKVYVSSDYDFILEKARELGAVPIKRPKNLCGNTPSVKVFRHAVGKMSLKPDVIVSIQANSPTVDERLIKKAKKIMETKDCSELMTCRRDSSIYGSIWAMTYSKLENYGDFGRQRPEMLLMDDSIDIHTKEDFNKAIKQI